MADPRIDVYPCALLRLREDTYEQGGRVYFDQPETVELPYVPVELCNHDDRDSVEIEGSRVCPECVDSWLSDWSVYLPADTPVPSNG